MTQKIKIVLAEDQELFRKSLAALLKTKHDFEVVAEATNGKELLDQLKQAHVDVVLLDVEMPVMDGKTTLEIMRKRFPEVKVIVLSMHADMYLMSDFMSRGASSYLCKNCNVKTLFRAIQVVKNEGYFFDNSTSKALMDTVLKEKPGNAPVSEVRFNERETEILKRICDGKTNKEIATSLNLSASTIDFHRSKIYSKANCSNVTELLKYALRNGIVALS
jgi:two-component system response regulator DegU